MLKWDALRLREDALYRTKCSRELVACHLYIRRATSDFQPLYMAVHEIDEAIITCISLTAPRATPNARKLVDRRSKGENQAGIFGGDRNRFARSNS